jgi:hypothetical protein
MSIRDLKKYLQSVDEAELREQIIDLYQRFKPVRVYYNFVFNPNENKLIEDGKFRISKEYFPVNARKAKTRRSVAHKLIKHFISLNMDPMLVGDFMLFNIEVAQSYSAEHTIKQEAFYKAMLHSFEQAVMYMADHRIYKPFSVRLNAVAENARDQNWFNAKAFERVLLS